MIKPKLYQYIHRFLRAQSVVYTPSPYIQVKMSSDPTRVTVVLRDPQQQPRFLSINGPENVVRPPWTANSNELIGRG